MIRKFLLCCVIVTVPCAALSEPVTLSIAQAEEVLNGVAVLGVGHDVVIKEGERERAIKVQYKGFSVGLILAISKNITALKPSVFAYQEARDKRQRDLMGDDGKLSGTAQRTFAKEIEAQRAETQIYDLVKIKSGELKLETNQISPAVLSAISPIFVVE